MPKPRFPSIAWFVPLLLLLAGCGDGGVDDRARDAAPESVPTCAGELVSAVETKLSSSVDAGFAAVAASDFDEPTGLEFLDDLTPACVSTFGFDAVEYFDGDEDGPQQAYRSEGFYAIYLGLDDATRRATAEAFDVAFAGSPGGVRPWSEIGFDSDATGDGILFGDWFWSNGSTWAPWKAVTFESGPAGAPLGSYGSLDDSVVIVTLTEAEAR